MADIQEARPPTAEGEAKNFDKVQDMELGLPQDDIDLARIDKVYKKLDLRIIPGKKPFWLCCCEFALTETSCSFLDTILSLLCNPLECRYCSDDEHRTAP